jgi:hypothetical protein
MPLLQLNGLGAVQCTDPYTGDSLICPPGTRCDPAGSGQCVGTVPVGTPVCPVGQNLTVTGETCVCPTGYEYDGNVNQCVVPGTGDAVLAALNPVMLPAVTPNTNLLLGLGVIGVVLWVLLKR